MEFLTSRGLWCCISVIFPGTGVDYLLVYAQCGLWLRVGWLFYWKWMVRRLLCKLAFRISAQTLSFFPVIYWLTRISLQAFYFCCALLLGICGFLMWRNWRKNEIPGSKETAKCLCHKTKKESGDKGSRPDDKTVDKGMTIASKEPTTTDSQEPVDNRTAEEENKEDENRKWFFIPTSSDKWGFMPNL